MSWDAGINVSWEEAAVWHALLLKNVGRSLPEKLVSLLAWGDGCIGGGRTSTIQPPSKSPPSRHWQFYIIISCHCEISSTYPHFFFMSKPNSNSNPRKSTPSCPLHPSSGDWGWRFDLQTVRTLVSVTLPPPPGHMPGSTEQVHMDIWRKGTTMPWTGLTFPPLVQVAGASSFFKSFPRPLGSVWRKVNQGLW